MGALASISIGGCAMGWVEGPGGVEYGFLDFFRSLRSTYAPIGPRQFCPRPHPAWPSLAMTPPAASINAEQQINIADIQQIR